MLRSVFSPRRTVLQEDIQTFATLTGDQQWIHVDGERARTGPFGTTVQHGFLTLGMATGLLWEVCTVEGFAVVLNYGLNKVRFPSPLRVGSRIRVHVAGRRGRRLWTAGGTGGRGRLPADLRSEGSAEALLRGRSRLPVLPVTPAERRTGSADQWDWGPMSEATRALAERAASQLGPEADLFGDHDAAGFGAALTHVLRSTAGHPLATARAAVRFADALTLSRLPRPHTGWAGTSRVRYRSTPRTCGSPTRLGREPGVLLGPAQLPGRLPLRPGRRRLRRLDAGQPERRRWRSTCCSTPLAPTNFLPTNPAALQAGVRHRRAAAW